VHGRVVVSLDEVAKGMADRGRLEEARGNLIEERLEGVIVVPVDEDDLGVGVLELVCGADSGEAAAEDENAGV